jgi:hypothetical protein
LLKEDRNRFLAAATPSQQRPGETIGVLIQLIVRQGARSGSNGRSAGISSCLLVEPLRDGSLDRRLAELDKTSVRGETPGPIRSCDGVV